MSNDNNLGDWLRVGAVAVVATVILWWTNPSLAKHADRLPVVMEPAPKDAPKFPFIWPFINVRPQVDYNDYFVFSTTSRQDGGGLMTLGILAMVFNIG